MIDDGQEEVFDLVEWARDHDYPDVEWPEDGEPGDDFFALRSDIEEAFHDHFLFPLRTARDPRWAHGSAGSES